MGIFDWLFGAKKNDKEAEKKSKIDNSNELPEWFDGEVYEEGDTASNPFSGGQYKLTNLELSMYDFIMGAQMIFALNHEKQQKPNEKLIKEFNKGLEWFKENNLEAYEILIEGSSSSQSKIKDKSETTNTKNETKDSVELKTTNLVKKTYNINWVNNMIAYDGAELLKKDFQLNNSINVPALFKDDGDVYIMIRSNTEASAKKLIDKIINENGGTDNFTKGSATGWAFPHHSDGFTIGYLTQHKVVRLNKH